MNCWNCAKETDIKETDYKNHLCPFCGVMISVYNPELWLKEQALEEQAEGQTTEDAWLKEGEDDMSGELARRAKEKSPYIRLAIGESSEPMIYKSWKEIVTAFGSDAFRFTFEVQTDKGLIQKTFDCAQLKFAEQMDSISFGSAVIIHRKQKLDVGGNPVEKKSQYEAEEVK